MSDRSPLLSDAGGIVDIATGYMAAKQLFAAAELGLFRALADGPRTADDLAATIGVPVHVARILGDGMSAVGLVERTDGRYANSAAAARYLTDGPSDLSPFLAFLDAVSYGHWRQFAATTRSGSHGELDVASIDFSVLGAGITSFHGLHATGFADAVLPLTGVRHLLDLGGQSAGFAIAALRSSADLRVEILYDEGNASGARDAVHAAGLDDRVVVRTAPTLEAVSDGSHDAVLLNHCIHRFSAEENVTILRHARASTATGALLLVVDFLVDDDGAERHVDAMHAAEYLVIDSTIVYPVSAVQAWMRETGWEPVEVIEIPGGPRVATARAI